MPQYWWPLLRHTILMKKWNEMKYKKHTKRGSFWIKNEYKSNINRLRSRWAVYGPEAGSLKPETIPPNVEAYGFPDYLVSLGVDAVTVCIAVKLFHLPNVRNCGIFFQFGRLIASHSTLFILNYQLKFKIWYLFFSKTGAKPPGEGADV